MDALVIRRGQGGDLAREGGRESEKESAPPPTPGVSPRLSWVGRAMCRAWLGHQEAREAAATAPVLSPPPPPPSPKVGRRALSANFRPWGQERRRRGKKDELLEVSSSSTRPTPSPGCWLAGARSSSVPDGLERARRRSLPCSSSCCCCGAFDAASWRAWRPSATRLRFPA